MYTPKHLRKTIHSICIGFDNLTIYATLESKVYRVVSLDTKVKTIDNLSTLYPNLFVDGIGKFGEKMTIVNLTLLPKFDQSVPNPMLPEHAHWFVNPDWSLAERAYNLISPQWRIDDRRVW